MTPSIAMRGFRLLVIASTVGIMISSVIAVAFAPILVRDAPVVLLLLQPTSAQMLLVSAKIDLVPFVLIATFRRLLSDLTFYLLGRWYGDRAVAWMKRKAVTRRGFIEGVERTFPAIAPPLIFFFVSPPVSTLAGATGMSPRLFVGLKLAGTLVIVFAHRFVADAASGPLSVVVRFIEQNAVPLTLATMAITLLVLAINRRRGGPVFGDVTELAALEGADEHDTPAITPREATR